MRWRKTPAGRQSGTALWFRIIKNKDCGGDAHDQGIFRDASCAVLAVAALMLAPLSGAKAAWPEKPIKIVLPFGAGGVADVTARIMADKLSQKFGQRVVIENMPGPGGINAARAVITRRRTATRWRW
jgi:hypothetical protein